MSARGAHFVCLSRVRRQAALNTVLAHWGILLLELRKYKNDGIAERNLFALKLPRFSLACTVREKGRQFQINKFPLAIESFLNCLYSSKSANNNKLIFILRFKKRSNLLCYLFSISSKETIFILGKAGKVKV